MSKGTLKGVIIIAMIAAFAVCGVIAAVVANSRSLRNTFTPGKTVVEIIEPDVDPEDVPWGTDSKPVSLHIPADEGAVSGVVRAMISPYAYTTGGETKTIFPGMARPVQNKLVMGDITLHFDPQWTNNWFYKDGYFYYNRVLNPGETTPLLLTGVTLSDNSAEMQAKYAALNVDIEVAAQVLQAGGGAPSEWGLSVDSSNMSVSVG